MDFREELNARIDTLQKTVNKKLDDKRILDREIENAISQLKIWREALQIEDKVHGKTSLTLFSMETQSYPFAGMKLIEAVASIRKDHPDITKEQTREILEKSNFDFKGKRPGTAVHMVWVFLDRRAKKAKT